VVIMIARRDDDDDKWILFAKRQVATAKAGQSLKQRSGELIRTIEEIRSNNLSEPMLQPCNVKVLAQPNNCNVCT
jgi:hypothetical protein